MTDKKIQKRHTKDQVKHNHREAFKGHRTRKHFIDTVKEEEAQKAITDIEKKNGE